MYIIKWILNCCNASWKEYSKCSNDKKLEQFNKNKDDSDLHSNNTFPWNNHFSQKLLEIISYEMSVTTRKKCLYISILSSIAVFGVVFNFETHLSLI